MAPRPDDEQLSVEDGAIGEVFRRGNQLRKAIADELLAACPERRLPAAAHKLRPHPIPLPFHLPARHVAEHGRGLIERRGEEERIGAARRRVGSGIEKLEIILRRFQPRGDEALEDLRRLNARHDGQRPGHERPRHPDAQSPGEELVPHDPLRGAKAAPYLLDQRALPPLVCLGADRIDRFPQAVGEPPPLRGDVDRGVRHRLREEQRERLGEIADVGIALLDEPVGDPRHLGRPRPQKHRRYPPRLAPAGEDPDGHGAIFRGDGAEIVDEQGLLLGGPCRRIEAPVEVGKPLHDSSPRSAGSTAGPASGSLPSVS